MLEIGCGSGGNADWYRAHGAVRLVGVEIDDIAAARAAARFDRILAAPVELALDDIAETFDLIVCADVLEHLVDPSTIASALLRVAEPGAALVISVPNVRHYRSLLRIAFGAGFRGEIQGPFDSTHLRFFTKANLAELLHQSGWQPDRWRPSPSAKSERVKRLLSRLTLGASAEYLAYQWYVVARRGLPANHADHSAINWGRATPDGATLRSGDHAGR